MNYPKVKLSEVAIISAGQAAPKDTFLNDRGDVPFVRAGHLEKLISGFDIESLPKISEEDAKANGLKLLKAGSVLFAKSGMSATLNRVLHLPRDSYYVSHLASIVSNKESLNSKYCYYFLQHFSPSKLIKDSAYPSIGLPDIGNIKIPLPPLPTQQKIAAILDKADSLRQKDKQLLKLYDDLAQSVFYEMFGDPVKNEKNWDMLPLNKVLTEIKNGTSPVCEDAPRENADEPAILKLSAVTYGIFNEKANKKLKKATNSEAFVGVSKGDLLFTRKNTYDLVGATAYVFRDYPRLFLPDTIFKLCYKLDTATGIYLWNVLSNKSVRLGIKKLASGSTGSMPNISKQRLMEFSIPVPDIHLQEKFDTIIREIEKSKESVINSNLKTDQLFQSLLQLAFNEELVKE
jgi:type I restriction enzyme S subunit